MAHIIDATATRAFLKKLKIAINLKATEVKGIAYFACSDLQEVLDEKEYRQLTSEVTSEIHFNDLVIAKGHIPWASNPE